MSSPQIPTDTAALEHGSIPLLGFGTWQIQGQDAVTAVEAALGAGYRHLDTATVYGNEAEVGRALAESDVAREDVFVTTKCPPDRADRALDTLRESLEKLQTDHVDLWLIHWPADADDDSVALWRTFLEAREQGLARDIGVSNFSLDLLDRVESETGVRPAVNQVRWSPLRHDAAVRQGHVERGVVLEGYSALRGGTLEDATIASIAEAHGVTPAQVIVRWHLQHGTVVIPKSTTGGAVRSERRRGRVPPLSDEDMAALDSLSG